MHQMGNMVHTHSAATLVLSIIKELSRQPQKLDSPLNYNRSNTGLQETCRLFSSTGVKTKMSAICKLLELFVHIVCMSEPATTCNTAAHAHTYAASCDTKESESAEQLLDSCSNIAARRQQREHEQQKRHRQHTSES